MSLRNLPSKKRIKGIVMPFAGVLDATLTATTQAGPRPGPARPNQRTAMALETSGNLDGAQERITLSTDRAGAVGEGTLRWKYASDATERNWDPPCAISDWEMIDRTTTASKWIQPCAVRRPDTGLAMVSVTDTANIIKTWAQDIRGKWSSATVEDTGAASTSCLIPGDSGRMLCIYTYAVDTAVTQLRMAYSDDDGATWTIGSTRCLDVPMPYASSAVLRLRGVRLNGQVCLLAWIQGATDVIVQYVSVTDGATFTSMTFSTADRACPDLAVRDGVIYCATIEYVAGHASTTYVPYIRKITSASQALIDIDPIDAYVGSIEWGSYAAGLFTWAECALLVDDDGTCWLYGVDHDAGSTKETVVVASTDGGESWAAVGASGLPAPTGVVVQYTNDTSTYMRYLTVAPERGRAVLVHTHAGNPTNDDSVLCAAMLGGWTTVCLPDNDASYAWLGHMGWEHVWTAIEEPDNVGGIWTKTVAGAPTSILGATGLALSAAAAESITYHATPALAASAADGIMCAGLYTAGTNSGVVEVRISNAANDYSIRVSIAGAAITVRDLNAGADVFSTAIDATKTALLLVHLDKPSGAWAGNNGRVRVWAMQDGPYTGAVVNYGPRADRELIHLGVATGLTAGAVVTSRVLWGLNAEGTGTMRWFAWADGAYVNGGVNATTYGPRRGRMIPSIATPIHIAEGLRVAGKSGPTVRGDTWHTDTDYENPINATNPSITSSPRRTHRTTGTSAATDIIWTGCDIGWRSGDIIALFIAGANWRTADLWRDSTAVNKVAALDLAKDLTGLAFTRSRGLLIPAAGGASAAFHFHQRSLVGATCDLGGGALRKVRNNHAGAWLAAGTPASYGSARIELETYGGGDPASGNMNLWMPGGLWLTTAMAATDTFMLRIPAQSTADGYIETGMILLGRFCALAHEWEWGRAVTRTPAYRLGETLGGGRRATRRAPSRPAITIAWSEPVETRGVYTKGSAPDYMTLGYGGADALAAYADTPRTVLGLLDETDGGVLPCVLVNGVPQQSGAPTDATPITLLDPTAALYGRCMSETVQLDNVLGDELVEPGEAFRIAPLRFEGEV